VWRYILNSPRYIPRSGNAGSYGNFVTLYLTFSLAMNEGSNFSTSFSTEYLFLLIIVILAGVNYFTVVLICIYLMTSDAQHLFICLLAICIYSLVKCPNLRASLKLCHSFSYWVECFIYSNKSFVRYTFCKHFLWPVFILLTVSFKEKLWILMPSNLSVSSFTDHAFNVVSKKS